MLKKVIAVATALTVMVVGGTTTFATDEGINLEEFLNKASTNEYMYENNPDVNFFKMLCSGYFIGDKKFSRFDNGMYGSWSVVDCSLHNFDEKTRSYSMDITVFTESGKKYSDNIYFYNVKAGETKYVHDFNFGNVPDEEVVTDFRVDTVYVQANDGIYYNIN